MSEFVSMQEAMRPILNAQIEQTDEWCEKHQCSKVKVKRTGSVLCLKCGHEERREFEAQKHKLAMSAMKRRSVCIILKILA